MPRDQVKVLASIERVVKEKENPISIWAFRRDPLQDLIYRLRLIGRADVADRIVRDLARFFREYEESEQVEMVLATVVRHIDPLFDLPMPAQVAGESLRAYEKRFKSIVEKELGPYLAHQRELKKYVSRLFDNYGYPPPLVDRPLIPGVTKPQSNADFLKIDDLEAVAKVLWERSRLDPQQSKRLRFYRYKQESHNTWGRQVLPVLVTPLEAERKRWNRKVRRALWWLTVLMGGTVGIGEGVPPAVFYYGLLVAALTALAVPVAVPLAIAVAVFGLAFTLNAVFFQGDSYDTFKGLFFNKGVFLKKTRLLYDVNGQRLSTFRIVANIGALGIAVFAALTLAGVAFYFSPFMLPVAITVSVMSFLGYTGVFGYALMGLIANNPARMLKDALKVRIVDPIRAAFQACRTKKYGTGFLKLASAVWNIAWCALIPVAMITVVVGTGWMFFGALSGIPLLVGLVGTPGLIAIVCAAELALGTFFSLNVARALDFLRSIPERVVGFVSAVPSKAVPHPVRQTEARQSLGMKISGVFKAVVNAGGYFVGYLSKVPEAHRWIAIVFPLPLSVARLLVAFSYGFASLGGNLRAWFNKVELPSLMPHAHDGVQPDWFKNYLPQLTPGMAPPVPVPEASGSASLSDLAVSVRRKPVFGFRPSSSAPASDASDPGSERSSLLSDWDIRPDPTPAPTPITATPR
jgi:hypothetical protein